MWFEESFAERVSGLRRCEGRCGRVEEMSRFLFLGWSGIVSMEAEEDGSGGAI